MATPGANAASTDASTPMKTPWGLYVAGGIAAAAASIMVISVPFVTPAMRGRLALPFVPANPRQVDMVMRVVEERARLPKVPGTVGFVDLGSGDGRVVLEAARRGVTAHGIELNLPLVLYSRFKALLSGVHPRPRYYRKNLWHADLSKYTTLCVFGVVEMMPTLEAKLAKEMRDDAILIACRFQLPHWQPHEAIVDPLGDKGLHSIWVYRKQGPPPPGASVAKKY